VSATPQSSEVVPEDELPPAAGDEPGGAVDASPTTVTGREGLRLIARFVREQPLPFAVSLIGGVGWSALVVGATYILGRITDEVIEPGFAEGVPASTVWWAVAALFVVALLRGLSVVVRRWFGSLTETRMQASLRRDVGERLLTMPMSSYRRRPTGQLLANADVDITMGTQLLMPLPFSVGVLGLVVISVASLLAADVAFAAVGVVLFPALAVFSRYYTNKVSEPASVVQARLGEVSSIAHESFDGALAVKTLGREDDEDRRFAAAADQLRADRLRMARMTAVFQPMIDLLPNLGMIVLLVVGAWRIDVGAATPGQLVQAVALFAWLAFPMRIVGFMFESLPRSVVSVRRVDALLAEPSDESVAPRTGGTPGKHLPDGPLSVEFDDVSFSYGPTTVLSGVTFDAKPGEVVAIVGSTGSGKSTLANLLARLDTPDRGTIRVGGVPLGEVDPDELRDAASVAFQESFLFASPVLDNVAMDRPVDRGDVNEVLSRARADRFVSQLPAGPDTVVGERGVTLSGGQRQRVALARALAGGPRLLVLDDATSAVDPVIEAEILAGLRGGDTTMLVVAHRLSTIKLADRVVHIDDGRVRSVGTHEELLGDPDYSALVTAYEVEEALDHDAAFGDGVSR
jgi:ATP-binding cassette, subfamily B, bacterial